MLKRVAFIFLSFFALMVLLGCETQTTNEIVSIEVNDLHEGIFYLPKDVIENLTLTITYKDGSKEVVLVDESMIKSADLAKLSTLGQHTITISYRNRDLTYTFELKLTEFHETLYSIYLLGMNAGTIDMTYEEWLLSIKGTDGTSIQSITLDAEFNFVITLSNLETITIPIPFQALVQALSFDINDLGELIVTVADETYNLGRVTGLSAFETYLLYHPEYQGTEEEWINSLTNPISTYHVYFYKDQNVSLSIDTQSLEVEKGTLIELPTASKEGYIFRGWKTSLDSNVIIEDDTFLVLDHTTLYPVFDDASIMLKFYVGDELVYTAYPTDQSLFSAPDIELEDEVYFKGWYHEGLLMDASKTISESLDLYAKFENDADSFTYTYLEDKDAYEIKGFAEGITLSKFYMPETYQNKPIVSIGMDAFYGYSLFEKIVFNSHIESIEQNAFAFTGKVDVIYFPSTMKKIGNFAFYQANVQDFTFHENITGLSIGNSAFYSEFFDGKGYREIYLPFDYVVTIANNDPIADMNTLITVKESLVSLYNEAVYQTNYRVFFSNDLVVKENEMYRYFVLDEAVTILKYIGTEDDVELPSLIDGLPVKRILYGAFSINIESLRIPSSVEEIAPNAFYGVKNIYFDGTLPPVIIKYPDDIFNKLSMIYVNPASVGVYRNTYALYQSQIFSKDSVVQTGTYEGFDYMVIDETVIITKYHGDDSHVVVPSLINGLEVKTIKTNTFNGINARISLYIPETITHIENNIIGTTNTFIYVILDTETLPNLEHYGLPTYLPILTRSSIHDPYKDYINVYPIDAEIFINDDAMYILENGGYTLVKYLGLRTTFEIPAMVNGLPLLKVGHMAFDNVSYMLTNLTFSPDSVVNEIGVAAFSRTYFQDLVLPSTVEKIGDFAFAGYYLDRFFNLDDFIINVVISTNTHIRSVTITSPVIPEIKENSILLTGIVIKVPSDLLEQYETIFHRSHLVSLDAVVKENNAWRYAVDQDGIHLIGYYGKGGHVDIPKYIEDKPVVSIASYVFDHYTSNSYQSYLNSIGITITPQQVTSILIPNTMKVLGHHFAYQQTLLDVYFEEGFSPTVIEHQPFYWGSHVYIHMSDKGNPSISDIDTEQEEFGYQLHYYMNRYHEIMTEDMHSINEFNDLIHYALLYQKENISFKLLFSYDDVHVLMQNAVKLLNFGSNVISYMYLENQGVYDVSFTYHEDAIATNKASLNDYYVQLSSGSYYFISNPKSYDTLPIDLLTKTQTVETSEQLWLAAMYGFKPMPVQGSVAEAIYDQAKIILNDIIDVHMTDVEKLLAIHDYMVMHIVYDQALLDMLILEASNHTYRGFFLEGAFLDVRAVCDGLAKTYTLLGRMLGLEVVYTEGDLIEENYGHAWNKVKVDGKWYNIDITFDNLILGSNMEEVLSHRYFMVPDSVFFSSRVEQNPMYEAYTTYDFYASYSFTHLGSTYDYVIESQFELNALLSYVVSLESESIDFEYRGNIDQLTLMMNQSIQSLGLPITSYEYAVIDHVVHLIIN